MIETIISPTDLYEVAKAKLDLNIHRKHLCLTLPQLIELREHIEPTEAAVREMEITRIRRQILSPAIDRLVGLS